VTTSAASSICRQVLTQLLGQRKQNLGNLALFRFAQVLQFVVRFDGLQRLDENRSHLMTTRRGRRL
jgi:hypothetical protein